ncbi:MAG TPA: NAD(P)H-quinone oxidoreductase [Dehalococcoidia bacterium]|nr:NAD(P)H-quinone oxidoreductase [Dehalococcoidia bacterium]
MRAIRFHELGGPEVLRYEEAPDPSPGAGEVLVRVRAAGVNYADTMFTRGRYFLQPRFPQIPGLEIAGEVVALGEGVKGIAPGDRVMAALANAGGYAELVAVPAHHLTRIPDGLGWAEAAAIPVQAVTADQVLHLAGRLQAGETVLVHAAAGGVGVMLVQMAKLAGARVIATASTEEKRELARTLGADVAVDYTKPGWADAVREATDGRGADVICEMVGGDVFAQSLRCLAPWGRLVVFGVAGPEMPSLNPAVLMRLNQTVVGYYLTTAMERADLMAPTHERIFRALESGRLRIVVGETAPLSTAADVHRRMVARETTGKLVLIPDA